MGGVWQMRSEECQCRGIWCIHFGTWQHCQASFRWRACHCWIPKLHFVKSTGKTLVAGKERQKWNQQLYCVLKLHQSSCISQQVSCPVKGSQVRWVQFPADTETLCNHSGLAVLWASQWTDTLAFILLLSLQWPPLFWSTWSQALAWTHPHVRAWHICNNYSNGTASKHFASKVWLPWASAISFSLNCRKYRINEGQSRGEPRNISNPGP